MKNLFSFQQDISNVFAFLRYRLQAKENELLNLQRADRYLLPPDPDQINMVINAINSLQLCTQEGSFVFETTTLTNDISSKPSICATNFHFIKALPSSIWLSPSNSSKENIEKKSMIFAHLFSLPMSTYLASSPLSSSCETKAKKQNQISSYETKIKTQNKLLHRIPIVNYLLFMPIDAFKQPSANVMISKTKNSSNMYEYRTILMTVLFYIFIHF